MEILRRRTQASGAPFMATSEEIEEMWLKIKAQENEIKKRDMVIDYLYRLGCMIHPSQLLMRAQRAIEQGVSLENVRTD